jgi:hypothetical protein
MAREQNLWDWMQRNGQKYDEDDLHQSRVENLVPPKGFPDVTTTFTGNQWYTELKGLERPKRPGTPLKLGLDKLSDSQESWLGREWRCGGRAWIYVRVGKGASTSRYLFPATEEVFAFLREGAPEADWVRWSLLKPNHSFMEYLYRACHRLEYPRE